MRGSGKSSVITRSTPLRMNASSSAARLSLDSDMSSGSSTIVVGAVSSGNSEMGSGKGVSSRGWGAVFVRVACFSASSSLNLANAAAASAFTSLILLRLFFSGAGAARGSAGVSSAVLSLLLSSAFVSSATAFSFDLRLRFLGVLAFSFSASGFSSFVLRLRLGFSEGMACMDSASMMLYINSVLSLDGTAFRLFAKAFSSSKLICSSSIFV